MEGRYEDQPKRLASAGQLNGLADVPNIVVGAFLPLDIFGT